MKITKRQLRRIIREVKEELNEDFQAAKKIDASRDLCQRLSARHAVEWDQEKSMRRQDSTEERCQSCMCGGSPAGTRRGPDGRVPGVTYFDPKDPAQKKDCLGF